MKKKSLYLVLTFFMLLFIISSCNCENPLSGLSWGTAILRGQVITETKLDSGQAYISGIGGYAGITGSDPKRGVMISTDVGNDYTYTVTEDDVVNNPVNSIVAGEDRPLTLGEFQMKIRFRIGSTAKSKKITVNATREDLSAPVVTNNINIIDGQATLPLQIKVSVTK
ncbi:hypothetical protein HZA55_09355 [Candidatus Poribacteria bacterium]|nr:hypothetical protein [Candidatus Poribacteria bacterium]